MDSFIDGLWNTSQQRLRKTFSAALTGHVLLLIGLSFAVPAGPPPSQSMDVTLALHHSDTALEQAEFVAQTNQLGTDDQQQQRQTQDPGQRPPIEQQRPNPAEQILLSHSDDQSDDKSETQASRSNQESNSDQQPTNEPDIGVMQAELVRLKQAYSSLPRVLRMTSVSAKSADAAAYMHYFEDRVEQIGNVNYPREARSKGIFGQVQLVVVLLANGRIKRIEVSKGSGSRLLDQAAVRSVQLAAPFNPFPKELRNRDEIHIIRTWQYQSNNVLTTN
jgi:protein TonB